MEGKITYAILPSTDEIVNSRKEICMINNNLEIDFNDILENIRMLFHVILAKKKSKIKF